ncbi:hypothetical protein SRABI112_04733 [Pseudomonas mediterranea]|nr:hypothetical protein SRABI112_04733 [Pseudomonas mediterranea]
MHGQFRPAQGLTQRLHESRLQAAHRHPATIPGAVMVIEAAAIEQMSFPAGFDPTGQVTGARQGVQAEHAIGHAHIQVLALPALLAGNHRRQQSDYAVQRPAGDVRRLDAQRQRAAVGTAGMAGQPCQGQVVDIVSGAVPVGAGLAVAGDRHVDEPGIDRLQRLIPKPQSLHHSGTELFQQNVVVSQQPLDHLQRFRLLEVQGQAALVAIEVGMAGGNTPVVGRQDA